MPPGRLSSEHHALIQTLLSKGPLEEKHFSTVFGQVTGKDPRSNRDVFKRYLLDINNELAYIQFELRACHNQYNGKVYYGVVNNVSDERSKFGTKYSPAQIAFYKGIIEAIAQDPAGMGSISSTNALCINLENQVSTGTGSESQGLSSQIPTAIKNFTMSQKEKTLEEFVRDGWLCSNSDGSIGLGVRSFLDLRSWFHNNEFPTCKVCNEAAVKAEACQTESCNVRIHMYCLKQKFSQRKADRACSGCGAEWRPLAKEELIDEEENDTNNCLQDAQPHEQPSQRRRSKPCKPVRGRKQEAASSETPVSVNINVNVSVSNTRRSTRSSTRSNAV